MIADQYDPRVQCLLTVQSRSNDLIGSVPPSSAGYEPVSDYEKLISAIVFA